MPLSVEEVCRDYAIRMYWDEPVFNSHLFDVLSPFGDNKYAEHFSLRVLDSALIVHYLFLI